MQFCGNNFVVPFPGISDFCHIDMQESMSRKFDNVVDINDSKETWRLVVRILDLWSVVNSKGIEHIEMIVVDANVWYVIVDFLRLFFLFLLYSFEY